MFQDEPQTPFRFAGFTLDPRAGRLFRAGEEVALRPKAFALLACLVRNRGRIVGRDELLTAVWPDVIVTDDSLTQCVHELRRAFGAEGAGMLRTVPRRGYLFDPATAPAGPGPAGTDHAPPVAGLRRDGIAVLPFALAGGWDAADARLLEGLAHDVIGRLARLRGFHVIARGSTFRLRHLAGDPQAAGGALGVRHVVTATGWLRGGRLRLPVEIADAADGGILWTGEFEAPRPDAVALIGEVADRIAHAVHTRVTEAETRRAQARPPEAMDAWECYHAGVPDAFASEAARIDRALDRFRTAARLSPGFARAHAAQVACHFVRLLTGMAGDPAAEVASARQAAAAAMAADPDDPLSPWSHGRVLWLEGDPAGCLDWTRRAVALCPSLALGHHDIGALQAMRGDPAAALASLDLFEALSPFDPLLPSSLIARATASLRLGRDDAAAAAAADAARSPTQFPTIIAPAALILAETGRLDAAVQAVARLGGGAGGHDIAALPAAVAALSDDLGALYRRHAARIGLPAPAGGR